jgi:hypothetical protein
MRRVVLGVSFLLAGALLGVGRPHRAASDDFDTWQKEPPGGSARAAQWRIAPSRGQAGEGAKIVVFFFGPGLGGSAKENIDAWAGLMAGSDGRPATADPQNLNVAGHKITQVMLSGSYAEPSSVPGIPPTVKPNYSLVGAVVENPGGNIYWQVTGPAAQVAALAPVLGKVLNSLKPQEGKP